MTLRRLGCVFCMSFISPFRSPFRPYNRAYAYSGTNRLRSAFHGGQRLLPIHGGDKIFLSGLELPVNLPQARYDGHGSINITFSGQKIRFHKDA
ncbi:MAG: hypothetical protein KZQ63_12945 [Candidatus Thiodiazotropha sp. (ex Lucinoma aequizonata)]|nr:hypothetical protein [Candidatus Thiodiazotropha sp. (ex Lucinoma aequizonata)]